jgi:hypothetical protein
MSADGGTTPNTNSNRHEAVPETSPSTYNLVQALIANAKALIL